MDSWKEMARCEAERKRRPARPTSKSPASERTVPAMAEAVTAWFMLERTTMAHGGEHGEE